MPRLSNVRIRSKLGVILLVPIIAILALTVTRVGDHLRTYFTATDAHALMQVSQSGAELVEKLQRERVVTSIYLLEGKDASDENLVGASKETDQAIEKYSNQRANLGNVPGTLKPTLDRINTGLKALTREVRRQIDTHKITITDAAFQYRIVISDLIEFRKSVAQFAGTPVLSDRIRGVAAISEAKEGAALEEVALLQAIDSGGFVSSTKREFIATLTAQEQALLSFAAVASPDQRDLFATTVTGEDVLRSEVLEREAMRAPTDGKDLKLSPGEISDVLDKRISKLRVVEEQLDVEVLVGLKGESNNIFSQLLVEALAMIFVLFIAALITLLIARSMALSLRRLREGALQVAYESLPQSVARLRNPETLGELTPDQVAAGVKDPVQVRGRDEIGQVSQAFNVVHREAVRIAAEQAALRANVATMFINLARRSQALVDRLIGHLDRLERGEEDPDRLAELFQLDHLATRMRRNDENLLVLAGADSTRVQRDPAPLADVLRAAQSEVEQYTRIEFGIVDRDVEVAPHAVNDAVHLLAELFDNATSFSPPDTVVVVDARRAGDRAILQIEDRGIGISAEQLAELNNRLANPPLVDVAVSRMMGLVVVGRLAARHGIRVELRAARDRGTIADVILPAAALILPQRTGRAHTLGLPQSRSPLALEGGQDPRQQRGGWQDQRSDRGAPAAPGAWDPAPNDWEPRPSWDRGMPPAAPASEPAAPMRNQYEASAPPAQATGSGGHPDRRQGSQLPRRRPGEGLTPTGQPTPVPQRDQSTLGDGPMDDVLSRRPAAEPRAGHDPRGYAAAPPAQGPPPSRESIHSAELPSQGSAPAGQPEGPSMGSSTFGITGVNSGGFPVVTPPAASASRPAPHPNGTPASAAHQGQAAGSSGAKSSKSDPSPVPSNADDTMELPIFREVESAWFRTKHPRPAAADANGGRSAGALDAGGTGATGSRPAPSPRQPASAGGQATGQAASAEQVNWRTAADDGWRAASAAADSVGTGTTKSGLPKRVPMAQLVPGGVDTPVAGTRNRSPDAVRGLLSAYHRGVQRGRQSSARPSSDKSPGKEQA